MSSLGYFCTTLITNIKYSTLDILVNYLYRVMQQVSQIWIKNCIYLWYKFDMILKYMLCRVYKAVIAKLAIFTIAAVNRINVAIANYLVAGLISVISPSRTVAIRGW